MKKLLIILSLMATFLNVSAFAGDGASGGGASSLWDTIFKTPNSMANPKYADDNEGGGAAVLYREDIEYFDTPILSIHSFTNEDGRVIEVRNIVAFIINEEHIGKRFDQLTLKDIKYILVEDGNGYPIENIYRIELH